ncbi:hypothetical protein A0O28_0112040 [Trichoderma guizhouense]|uniref:CUE domain-containing protein n=1 Tax=Trichoderma guizhouense TaxID=1491466 RepID=A0A1T3C4K3_9HYPO|nr:hypothetical protein A0O28_0112040 [Trichoderma guizhouense]
MSNIALPSQLQQLRDSFHSLLDDSLIVAIASDYDLSTSTGYDEACSTLRSLAQNVVFEEASSFDPSGAYRFTEHEDQSPIDDAAPASKLNQGDVLSDDESIDTLSSDSQLSKSEVLEKDILQLQSLFPRIDGVDIRQVLTNANGVVAAALDSLLNLQYIQSTSDQAPSSNGLLDANESGAKSVGKAGEAGYDTSVSNSRRLNTPAAVTYIAKRLHMSTEEVSII